MTDDQNVAQMRALRRTQRLIGDEGVGFEENYATDPLCCPSRVSFLTGQYAHNHGVISNVGPNAFPALREHDTLGVWLRRAGYRTAFVGKFLNEYGADDPEHVPPGWDEWHALVDPSTQDYVEYDLNENGKIVHYGPDPAEYKTTVLGEKARAAIRRGADGARPFFLYVGFNAPHAPSTPTLGDDGRFTGRAPNDSPAFDEADLSDKPKFIRDHPPFDDAAFARIADRDESALESLLEVDRQVAAIVAELDDLGELENTYVVFTSDNGYIGGEHGIEFGKLVAYRGSSRVPLLIRGPGIPAGETSRGVHRQHRPRADDRGDHRRRADGRDRRDVAAAVRRGPGADDRAPARDRVADPRPVDLLRLPLRGDPHRALPLRRLGRRRGGALRLRARPLRARVGRRRSGLRRDEGRRSPTRSPSAATAPARRAASRCRRRPSPG